MEDDELAAIRAKRLAQLQASGASNSRGGSPSGIPPLGPGSSQADRENAEQQKKQQEETRRSMLSQILSNEARERCSSHSACLLPLGNSLFLIC